MARQLVLMKHSTVRTKACVEFQCKEQGHEAYDYEIEITTGDKLDENDFIIDHTVIHDVIVNVIQNKMGSCERLCLRVEEDVLAILRLHRSEVQRLVFCIKPITSNAWVKLIGEYDVVREIVPQRTEPLREPWKLREIF